MKNLRKALVLALALALAGEVAAFQSDGPPPEKTIEWTAGYLTGMTVPKVDFDGSDPLGACLSFLEIATGVPVEYGVKIDGAALGEEKLNAPVSLQARNLKLLEVLAKLADAVDADVVIGKGKVSLVPKKKEVEKAVVPEGNPAPPYARPK